MKCPVTGKPCLKHKAYHVVEKKEGKFIDFLVCEDCLYNQEKKIKMVTDNTNCKNCKTKLDDVLKGEKLGCQKCYQNFEETIKEILKHVQKTEDIIHKGSIPSQWKMEKAKNTLPSEFLEKIKFDLELAIEKEEYEIAIEINKTLNNFEKKLKKYKKQIKLDEKEEDEKKCQAHLIKNELDSIIYNYSENINQQEL